MSEKSKTWQEKSAVLEKAYRKLVTKQSAEAVKKLIPLIVKELMQVGPKAQAWRLPPRPDSDAVPLEVTPTKGGLEDFASLTGRLVETIDKLSPTAIERLNQHQISARELHVLNLDLRAWHASAEAAAKVKGRAGRPTQVQQSPARKIASAVRRHYRILTGDDAKVPQRLIELLNDVYKALDMDANARGQLEAIEEEGAARFPTTAEYAQEIIRRNAAKRRDVLVHVRLLNFPK